MFSAIGSWLASWPRRRRSAILLGLAFWLAGLLAARLDGLALINLPFGPMLADGVPVIAAAPATDVAAIDTDTAPRESERRRTLIIATEGGYPPFNFVDAVGELRGLEVDLVYALCDTLDADCTLVQRPWDDLLPGLETGDHDIVASSLRVPEVAAEGIVFSQPYFQTVAAYAVHDDHHDGWQTGPVGVESGTRMHRMLVARPDGPVIQPLPDAVASYEALIRGDVAAVLDDAVRLNRWLNHPSGRCCRKAGPVVVDPVHLGRGTGFALRAADTELLSDINDALASLAADGRVAELTDRYLPFALN